MPEDIDIARCIRRDGAAAIKPSREGDEVALRLEATAGIIEVGVPHRDSFIGSLRDRLRPVPRDMHAAVLPEREVRAANGPGRDGAARLTVHWNRIGESFTVRLLTNVEDVSARSFALEIYQMNNAVCIDDCLRLDAAMWRLDSGDQGRNRRPRGNCRDEQREEQEHEANGFHINQAIDTRRVRPS